MTTAKLSRRRHASYVRKWLKSPGNREAKRAADQRFNGSKKRKLWNAAYYATGLGKLIHRRTSARYRASVADRSIVRERQLARVEAITREIERYRQSLQPA